MIASLDVLVVDDSQLMQRLITTLLEKDESIRVVATASDGWEALEKVKQLAPDVVTLDIEMPKLDGLSALRLIMEQRPTPVVVLSGVDKADIALQALELGAVEFVAKPSGTISIDLYKIQHELVTKVKLATLINLDRALSRSATVPPPPVEKLAITRSWLVIIGASTGGPRAITKLIRALPGNLPAAVLIVQHMALGFTASFAKRLDGYSGLHVQEAVEGQLVSPGEVYLAPGGKHLLVREEKPNLYLQVDDSPTLNGVRPAVDKLLFSVAELKGYQSIGVILTGMGHDGARGLAALHKVGGHTIAQDQASSTIFGMPKAAIECGAVEQVLPLEEIPAAITALLKEN